MLTHSPSSDTCPLVILQNFPQNISLISQKAHHTFLIWFNISSPCFCSFWPLESLLGPLLHPFLWQNSPLKCLPLTYSWNYVHNKYFFHNQQKHKATKKALKPLLFWPAPYRAPPASLCITAVEVPVLQSCLQGRPFQAGISAQNCPPDSCTCMVQRSDHYPWRV